jgi:hypothetical protein
MKIDWSFQRNEDGSSQGWNDPLIAEFKSNRLESLTRETIQNSLDARESDDTPVVVEFKESLVSADRMPNIETLQQVIKLCEKEKKLQNPDMIKELPIAKETAHKQKIPVLSVSDYHTKGMKGPCLPGEPFYQYLKAVGQSGGDPSRAGSHGLGKGAPLACSDLRTIFVSTVWPEGKAHKSLVQGRAVLMSFTKDDGIYKSTGYWGDAKNYQALEPDQIPEKYNWLTRKQVGTTVHIVGWNRLAGENWAKLIIGYAISSFFAAFMRGKLILEIDKFKVDATNVYEMAKNESIMEAMKRNKYLDKLEDAIYYMRCLGKDDTVIKEETQLIHLGRTSIRMMVADDAPRKMCLIRNNMLITDTIPGFWKKIPGKFRDFVGVVEVLNADGSQFIRLMEPPSHNSLSKDWLPTPEDRKKGELVLEKLSDAMKNFVSRHAGGNDEVFGKVDFMAEFFADEAGDDRGDKVGEEIDPNGKFTFSPKAIKLPPVSKVTLESELEEELDEEESPVEDEGGTVQDGPGMSGGKVNTGGSNEVNGNSSGEGFGEGAGGSGERAAEKKERDKPSHPIHLRNVRIVKTADQKAKVFVTPSANGQSLIRVHEVGSDFDEPFDVIACGQATVQHGGVEVTLKQGKRMMLEVELSRPIVGGLKLVASHATKPAESKSPSKAGGDKS